MMNIFEGGNVFKNSDGELTQRINQQDVEPTLKWLEQVTGLPLVGMELGTTGKKPTSGDLDIAVDINVISKGELINTLKDFLSTQGIPEQDWMNLGKAQNKKLYGVNEPKNDGWIKDAGNQVHFKTPIRGASKNGFVQTDFMFVPNVEYSKYGFHSAQDSNYKGAHRNIMLASMAKASGYKINQRDGLVSRDTNKVVSTNWDEIAKLLLNPTARREDLHSVETIMSALSNDSRKEEKIHDARETFAREGLTLEQGVSETSWLAKLRDRIATPGIYGLYESQIITEANARIEHLEDLVFAGRDGIDKALHIVDNITHLREHITIKWDGKPAVIFGRNEDGKFVLTDKSGFTAKGYDGLATSPKQMADIQNARGEGREELIAIYTKLFPLLEQTIPLNMKGYIMGDLMYANTPVEVEGKYSFTPNTVTYEVDTDSDIGRAIGKSEVCVAIHTFFDQPGASGQPIKDFAHRLKSARGVLILDPYFDETPTVTIDQELLDEVQFLKSVRGSVSDFMDPANYKPLKLSDLPMILKRFINVRVRMQNFDNLGQEFVTWLATANISAPKQQRILEYILEYQLGFENLVSAFRVLNDVKVNITQQLDNQTGSVTAHQMLGRKRVSGGEGFVASTKHGPVKFVDRFKFSAQNFKK